MSESPTDPVRAVEHGRVDAHRWSPLMQTATLVGQDVWLEQQIFELLGRWAAHSELPSATVHLGAQSRRHGWHSQLFFDRLPELSAFDAAGAVRAPGAESSEFFDALARLDDRSPVVRLAVHNRVLLPLLIVRYRSRLASSAPVADASLQRWLRIVIADDLEEWCEGEMLLDELLDADALVAVGTAQRDASMAVLRTQRFSA